MVPDLSVLKLTSAMARHAAQVHGVVGDNIARTDLPGANARAVEGFASALARLGEGERALVRDTRTPIALDKQMTQLATNAGRHEVAVTVWSKTLEMMRLAGGSPR